VPNVTRPAPPQQLTNGRGGCPVQPPKATLLDNLTPFPIPVHQSLPSSKYLPNGRAWDHLLSCTEGSDESEAGGQCDSTSRSVSRGDERDKVREGETRGTSHRLSEGRGHAAKMVVAGASSKVGVTKCVRGCWRRESSVQRRGAALRSYSRAKRRGWRQTASGTPNPKRQHTGYIKECGSRDRLGTRLGAFSADFDTLGKVYDAAKIPR